MDMHFSAAETAFRHEVRQFLASNLPPALSDKVLRGKRLGKQDVQSWHRILFAQGWVGASWPRQFGGPGWTPIERHIFDEECALAGAPLVLPFGVNMVGPILMAYGSPAQQEYFLPRILNNEHWWCQGYSEPGAGSDLAAVKTRAERVSDANGDYYLVNGQKTWNTHGHFADWMFCLVRTNTEVRAQAGISFLLIDMKSPGITLRPIRMLDGEHEINEVWLDNVRVPVANLVGEEDRGWTYAKHLLGHERTVIAAVGRSKRALKKLKETAATQLSRGEPLLREHRFRDRIAQIEIELLALEMTAMRVLSAETEQRAPGPEASLLKVRGSEIQQALSELTLQVVGHHAIPLIDEDSPSPAPIGIADSTTLAGIYLNDRKVSIYGGSNEIQKNIIAQMMLAF